MPSEQLPLSIPGGAPTRLPDRIALMQPVAGAEPFDDPGFLFEPWWPGVRALAFMEGGSLRLQASGLADADAAFPELADELPGQMLDDGVVLDGTLLVLDAGGRIDAELMRGRLSRGALGGRPAYVAADLLWSDGQSWARRPFEARRERLESVVVAGDRFVVGRALRGEGRLLAEALVPMGIGSLSAHRLQARYRAGLAPDAWLRIPTAAQAAGGRPQLALIQRLPLS